MRSSVWQAHGNVYEVADRDAGGASGTDGVVEILRVGGDEVEIRIVNPDGSIAEMSGNGTRIAAAWLIAQTGAERARVRVGTREVEVRALGNGLYESEMGRVDVSEPETIDGIDVVRVSVGNPHAVVRGDPGEITRIGPLLETHAAFPERTNVQVARVDGAGDVTARVWERGVGETASSGTSAVAVAAATHAGGEVTVHFPGGDLLVRLENGRAWLTGPAERVA
jgi:diaminopimelate epimerase